MQLDTQEHIKGLHQHLVTLEDLYHRFLAYQTSFNKLLVEIARRRQYREAADKVVQSMTHTLETMTEGIPNYLSVFHLH